MSTIVDRATEIRPFRIEVSEEQIADLRRRIEATRFPSKELVEDRSQGVQPATIQELARYWRTEYDFSRTETRLNALPPFPRSWVEAVYPGLAYFNEVDRGGDFAAWEEPERFSTEVRAAFRSLR